MNNMNNKIISESLQQLSPVLADFLHVAENAGPEEDLGMAEPELLLLQLDSIEHSCGGALVVLGLRHGLSSQNVVPCLELRVGNFVGETLKGLSRDRSLVLACSHHLSTNSNS